MKEWVKVGLAWGIWMFVAMAFFWPLLDGQEITLKITAIKFIFWMFGGLIFGYIMVKFKKYRHVIYPNKKENF